MITGVTALWLHGVEVGSPMPIRAATATKTQSVRPEIRLSRVGRLPECRRRVATPSAAWLAACTEFDLVEAVAAADWLTRLGRTTPDGLQALAAQAAGRGCRLARRAAGLCRAGAESPKETELRLLLVLAGLPEPRCNPRIGTAAAPIGRMDLVLEDYKTIIEYDGDQHRTDPWQWSRDIARHEAAVAAGYRIIRVTNGRLTNPREIAETTYTVLTERGYSGRRPTYTPLWRSLFEGRRV
ncbi:DUF559 domain-containing protein [Microlunatus parietis]|uniref:DUF559 domain-containing protein n=1 Tax=Microlunatus parietis TaxID=682979 RepID=A0A7Y9I853_9ACTN|nr:DUF559 domain-containing protein [Microlunatus parietis]NYE71830.1 hypothetical protein [Microlunatus parietis]